MDPLFSLEVMLRTKPGKLEASENVAVEALTPTIAAVYWMPFKKLNCAPVIYKIYWTLITNSTRELSEFLLINKIEHKVDSKFFTIIEPLIPAQKYRVYVRIYPLNYSELYTDSLSKTLYMYSEPNNITLNEVSINGTRYEFCLILRYPKYKKNFTWPSDGRFTFSTLTSDSSNSPGIYSVVTQYYQYIISSLVAMVIVIFICYYSILQEMPDGLLVHFNMSYNPILQYDSDEYVLIRITREQIKLEKLLGSGAFGMVYQGKVKNLGRTGIEILVAVKMLRKNASSQERKMFLEEARLMKYFRHKHVLRLLAICLDPEIPSIVLELMETGDLLQYLRDSRKLQPSDSQALRLQDLFAICEDVARGCRYLEDLRFVHRDLACRNCLVSAGDRENRVVKIGDFGLSRDIYNSDYYRKKGQDLLPIRWMVPESLVVRIFTSQSDVWSFGIIMWEITSLGEHPYTGRTILEMIEYVRTGGRLPMPPNCPPTLYELILRCWSSANDRPNFKHCLKNIIALRNNIEDTLLSPMDII
ncbi:Tyrosine-protein kinase transforming protein ros [Formica fusca]